MPQNRVKMEKVWDLISAYRRMDPQGVTESIANHLEFSQCKNRFTAEDFDVYRSLALCIRDRLVEFWNDTQQTYHQSGTRQVYYLSLEYLIGRSLRNNLVNLGIYEECRQALQSIGYSIEEMEEMEHDAGLGNGGLGRLAACFLDSMATLQLPAQAYGIRYEYGIFQQKIEEGRQVEDPDNWLKHGYPWEIPRWAVVYPVQFFGSVERWTDENGRPRRRWIGAEAVHAMAYDIPISGYGNHTVNNLRLWSAKATQDFDFQVFNRGDYLRAVEEKQRSETISKVLYPNDQGFSGKELRLKQQYFFVSASLQDIMRRFRTLGRDINDLNEWVAIQLNDTHPSIAIPELMRLLMDEAGVEWEPAWEICRRVFSYTNHTVLPEALERWPVDMLGRLLPRHLEIIFEINRRFLDHVCSLHPDDGKLLERVSLVEEGHEKQIRMPHLSIVGSHAVNGVARLHSELLKTEVFRDFHSLFPKRFQNKTNGITPRLWLQNANQELSELITSRIGGNWVTRLEELQALRELTEEDRFRAEWREVHRLKKKQFAQWLKEKHGEEISPWSLFDVQIKRIHEYKRQLLNLLHVVLLYHRLREGHDQKQIFRTVLLSGKAAPGYERAKQIVNLANDIARVVNADQAAEGKLRVVFVPNYGVSIAEKLIPATDLSQHISTAGMEASGTGNMKFVLNGSLIMGTLDGATIEIREEVGEENVFIFGMNTEKVKQLRKDGYRPQSYVEQNPDLIEVFRMIDSGHFNSQHPELYSDMFRDLKENDYYLLLADFESYAACHQYAARQWRDQERWTRMSIRNTAGSGRFSSDRTIREYASEIWNLKPVPVELHGKKVR